MIWFKLNTKVIISSYSAQYDRFNLFHLKPLIFKVLPEPSIALVFTWWIMEGK